MELTRIGPGEVFYGDPTQANGAGMQYLGETRDDIMFSPEIGLVFGRSDQQGRAPVHGAAYSTGPAPVVGLNLFDEEKTKLAAYYPDGEIFTRQVAAEAAPAAWAVNTQYSVGDKVTQGGDHYIANRNHRSVAGDMADGAPDQDAATAWDDYTLQAAYNVEAFGGGAGWKKLTPESLCVIPQSDLNEGTNGIRSRFQIWLPSAQANGFGGFRFRLQDPGNDAFERRETSFMGLRRKTTQDDTAIPRAAQLFFIGPPEAVGLSWSLPEPTP